MDPRMKVSMLLIILLILPQPLMAKRTHPEKWYQQQWCEANGGQVEVVLTQTLHEVFSADC